MSLAALARQAAPPVRPPSQGAVRAPMAAAPTSARRDGFDSLVKYIPTETVTIFVALCSARPALETVAGGFSYLAIYLGCAALTPVLLVLIAFGRHRTAGASGRLRLHWWPLFAATAAFLVWSLSVPGVTTILAQEREQQEAWGILAGVGAVLVSLALSLLEPVLGPRLTPSEPQSISLSP